MRTRILAAAVAVAATIVSPAGAAEPDIKKLFAGYKSGYDQLATLSADDAKVKKAKADLMERFRGALETEFTVLFLNSLRDPVNAAGAAVKAAVTGLTGQHDAAEAAVTSLPTLQTDLAAEKVKLTTRITTLTDGQKTTNTTITTLVGRIRALGGTASLEDFDIRHAFYPARPLLDAIGRGDLSLIPPGWVRFAFKIKKISKSSGRKHSGSSISGAAKSAIKDGFGSASHNLTSSDLPEIKSYVRSDGPKGLSNFPNLGEMMDRPNLKNLMPKAPSLPAPPVNLPTPNDVASGQISKLQGQLTAARKSLSAFDGQLTGARTALGETNAAIDAIPARLADAKARAAAFKTELDTLQSRLTGLTSGQVMSAQSFEFDKTTADQLFTKATTPFTSNVTMFGTKVPPVKTTFDFGDPEKSMKAVLDKLRASDAYKKAVEG